MFAIHFLLFFYNNFFRGKCFRENTLFILFSNTVIVKMYPWNAITKNRKQNRYIFQYRSDFIFMYESKFYSDNSHWIMLSYLVIRNYIFGYSEYVSIKFSTSSHSTRKLQLQLILFSLNNQAWHLLQTLLQTILPVTCSKRSCQKNLSHGDQYHKWVLWGNLECT